MAENPTSFDQSAFNQPACVRPQVHAPLAALLSALAGIRGSEDTPINNAPTPGGFNVNLGGENRGKSAFAPIPSMQSGQHIAAAPGIGSGFELPAHLKLALAQMNNQPLQALAQDTGSSCQLPAMGSRAIDLPAPKVDADDSMDGEDDQDTSSNQAITTASPTSNTPLSAEAKRKRRQEINRESARRVRKRKSEAHKKLQEEVAALKSSLAAITADQSVIVRYASELFKERESILRKATDLENKWVTAECQLVVLRTQVADLQSKLSQSTSE